MPADGAGSSLSAADITRSALSTANVAGSALSASDVPRSPLPNLNGTSVHDVWAVPDRFRAVSDGSGTPLYGHWSTLHQDARHALYYRNWTALPDKLRAELFLKKEGSR